jgi:hypothetical protein
MPEQMTADRWRLVRDRFEEIVDLRADEVGPWLREREADPAIRDEVASLLDHHSRAGSFLEAPAGDLRELLGDEPTLTPGQRVGPYAIVREAGRGLINTPPGLPLERGGFLCTSLKG